MRLAYIAFGWAAGIVLAANAPGVAATGWLAIGLLLTGIVWFTWDSPDLRLVNLVLLALVLGAARMSIVEMTSEVAAYNNTGGMTLQGVVVGDPDVRDDRTQIRLRVDTLIRGGITTDTAGLILARLPRLSDVRYGDRVAVTGLLFTPAEFDTFSYADYLARNGIYSIMDNTSLEVLSRDHGNPVLHWLYNLRRTAHARINRHLPEPSAGLLAGILLGNEQSISPELQEDFQRVGASHVVAISGFNMAVVAGVLMALLDRNERKRWSSAGIGVMALALYTLLVGANAAVVRAAIMSSLLIIGGTLKRSPYIPASLAFVALLMTLQNPNILWDVSFQLSFAATLGMALFVKPLNTQLKTFFHRWLAPSSAAVRIGDALSEPLVVTVAAQITTLPLIVLYFGRVSLVFLIVNLLIVPVQALLLILGGLATLVAFLLPPLAQILYWFDLVLLQWTITVVRTFADLPFADVDFQVDRWLIVAYLVIVIGGSVMHVTQPSWWLIFTRFLRRQAVMSAALFAGVATAALLAGVALSRPDGRLRVWFLDMGHSNAVFMQTPGGAHILVDGGRFPSRLLTAIGDRLPFTDREIEVLAVTQPDEFDIGALTAVLERYDVGIVLTNGQPNLGNTYLTLQDSFAEHTVVAVRAGYTLDFDDGTRLEVLHPQSQPTLNDGFDDHTLVLRISYGAVSFLLTSDLSAEGQVALLDSGQWPLAVVLQLPQHGTARSLNMDFLTAVQPQAVVIQSDRANRRGDPDPDVLSLLSEIPVFRTDLSGDIHVWTDGQTLYVQQD